MKNRGTLKITSETINNYFEINGNILEKPKYDTEYLLIL